MRRSDEIKFRKAEEVDADHDVFTADCLKDMAAQKPDQLRWDEEDQTLYIKVGILREAAPGKFSSQTSITFHNGEELKWET